MTHTPLGAIAMWSMFARLRGTARSCNTTTRPSRRLASSVAKRSSPPAPRSQTASCVGSPLRASSAPPMRGCLSRTRCSRFTRQRSCSRRALAPAVPTSNSGSLGRAHCPSLRRMRTSAVKRSSSRGPTYDHAQWSLCRVYANIAAAKHAIGACPSPAPLSRNVSLARYPANQIKGLLRRLPVIPLYALHAREVAGSNTPRPSSASFRFAGARCTSWQTPGQTPTEVRAPRDPPGSAVLAFRGGVREHDRSARAAEDSFRCGRDRVCGQGELAA